MTILTKSPRKVNRPAGFYDIPAPRPPADLRLFLDDRRVIVKLHIKGENAYRWHKEIMTVESPFMLKFLAGYSFIEEYRVAHIGLTVRAYRLSELAPAPVGKNAHDLSEITAATAHDDDGNSWGGAPVSPAMSEAQGLMSEYPELDERIDRALLLVEAGQTEFSQYNTRFDPAGFYGYRDCDCGDAVHRQPRAKFGIACKHTLAQEIAARVERTAWRVANQKLASDSERRAAALRRNDYANPADYRPAADPLNRKAQRPVYQFGSRRVK